MSKKRGGWCGFRVGFLGVFLGLAVLSLPVSAFQEPVGAAFPENIDLRQLPGPADLGTLADTRAQVGHRFQDRVGANLAVHWGDLSSRPVLVFRPGGTMATVRSGDRVAAVRDFLRAGGDLFGLTDQEIDSLDAAKVYETAGPEMTHVQFLQRIDGISVFRGHLRVNLDRMGGIINIGGEYFTGLGRPGSPTVSAAEALRTASLGIGLSGDLPPETSAQPDGERRTVYQAGGEYMEAPEARLVIVPEGLGRSRLAWEVLTQEAVSGWGNLYRTLVDARTGELFFRELMTLYAGPTTPADAVGLVFEESPIAGPQLEMSFAGDPVASPLNWIDAGGTETIGNNITARADLNSRNSSNNPAADGGKKLKFNFPFQNSYELSGDFTSDMDASITNAFYIANTIHDHLYQRGWDEASGNYQVDNFGRGGLQGDPVNVDVLDGAGTQFFRNNANFSPSLDGVPGRTQYFIWTDPPWKQRDGAFDATVIWHEFGHGLSTRLVGGPSTQCLSGTQGGGMGEGWGDWLAVQHFNQPGDDPAGPVVVGEYVTGKADIGIRRYPYAYDMALDPLTYADLCNAGCEVHREGEIWAATLWDMRHDLILDQGFALGAEKAEFLVVDGMKLSPCSPNMITMRDSIYQADDQRYAGADMCVLRGAFARRGMGAGASSNGTGADATADFRTILPIGASLAFSTADTFGWETRAGAVAYPVARGTFGPDASANLFDNAACQGEAGSPSYTDGTVPVLGNGFYYLVAVRDGCFLSGYGTGSGGAMRTVTACP